MIVDVNRDLVISMISLIRLIEGGAAIFDAEAINHRVVRFGNSASSPLVRYKFRV